MRYFTALFRFVWRHTENSEIAKELTQEAFLRIWQARKRLAPDRSIKAYLYRIANNLIIDYRRKQSRQRDYLAKLHPTKITIVQQGETELRDHIYAEIEALPEPLKLVFTLNRFEGFKYKEIAESLGVSVKTVEIRMSKALKILRKRLQPFLPILISFHLFS